MYSEQEVLEMVDFLLDNLYIEAFGCYFRQVKGIIMGGKSSGFLSDLSLMVDEFRYIDGKIKLKRRSEAVILGGLNRYRDDCTALNILGFVELARGIYHGSLSLTQENGDLSKADVLDMCVQVKDGIFETKVFNKTDGFPFSVVSLPHLGTNMGKDVCYRVFYGEVLRYVRLCSLIGDFEVRVRKTGLMLLARSYEFRGLRSQFSKVLAKYRCEFEKWLIPLDTYGWFRMIIYPSQVGSGRLGLVAGGLASFSQVVSSDRISGQVISISQP